MNNTDKNREQGLRRALNKAGYSLHKSRSRISIDNLGRYMITLTENNAVVAGSRYELTLDDVQEWLTDMSED